MTKDKVCVVVGTERCRVVVAARVYLRPGWVPCKSCRMFPGLSQVWTGIGIRGWRGRLVFEFLGTGDVARVVLCLWEALPCVPWEGDALCWGYVCPAALGDPTLTYPGSACGSCQPSLAPWWHKEAYCLLYSQT